MEAVKLRYAHELSVEKRLPSLDGGALFKSFVPAEGDIAASALLTGFAISNR